MGQTQGEQSLGYDHGENTIESLCALIFWRSGSSVYSVSAFSKWAWACELIET